MFSLSCDLFPSLSHQLQFVSAIMFYTIKLNENPFKKNTQNVYFLKWYEMA